MNVVERFHPYIIGQQKTVLKLGSVKKNTHAKYELVAGRVQEYDPYF